MNQLSIAHINAQSLTDDFYLLRDHTVGYDYDIVAVTETFINLNITDIRNIQN